MHETKKRSIAKSISYRIGCIIITLAVVYLISKDIKLAGIITVVHQIIVTMFYYLHERVWNRSE
ncbi:hypothetical protein AKJ44_00740 [candidate division MSBL1 archaeon SCGC-AAA261F17]|uniref:DUF2061 domain-containing protein n=1 Tax=candidate division MSBL1 archaeon SCGC-AAA261F17 TaxID=1698274 RepID=A0A133V7D2_9EURY|nr:hypothetical protein AKJ44_00740 [candidate division MSBL1 archaeon SCGC-AAA261F17]